MTVRTLRALLVPADPSIDITEITGTFHTMLAQCQIDFPERVQGFRGREHGFILQVDDSGRDRRLPGNRRAQWLIGYPGTIAGDALILCEAWVDEDDMPGYDNVDVKQSVIDWVQSEDTKRQYIEWTMQGCPNPSPRPTLS